MKDFPCFASRHGLRSAAALGRAERGRFELAAVCGAARATSCRADFLDGWSLGLPLWGPARLVRCPEAPTTWGGTLTGCGRTLGPFLARSARAFDELGKRRGRPERKDLTQVEVCPEKKSGACVRWWYMWWFDDGGKAMARGKCGETWGRTERERERTGHARVRARTELEKAGVWRARVPREDDVLRRRRGAFGLHVVRERGRAQGLSAPP